MSTRVGSSGNVKDLFRKDLWIATMLSLQSFLREGVSLGYVETIQNLKDLKMVGVERTSRTYR